MVHGDFYDRWKALVVISDFALALGALLGTLLVPFFVLYQMLRLMRKAIRIDASAAQEGNRR